MRGRGQRNDLPTHAIGIDISDGSLELVDIGTHRDGSPRVLAAVRTLLSHDTITHGVITNERALAQAFHKLAAEARIVPEGQCVVIALPDEQVITKLIPLPKNDTEHRHADLTLLAPELYRSLGYRIPGPVVRWHYRPHRKIGQPELVLFVTRHTYVQQWRRFFAKFKMKLVAVEMESLALSRALLLPFTHHDHVALIDFGFRQTNLSIFDRNGLSYSHCIEGGGVAHTRALAEHEHISQEDAERLKKKARVHEATQDPVSGVMRSVLEKTITEVRESMMRYHLGAVRSVIITGGEAQVSGIRKLCQELLGLPVTRAQLRFQGQTIAVRHSIPESKQQLYAGAFGLALRGLDGATIPHGINFISEE